MIALRMGFVGLAFTLPTAILLVVDGLPDWWIILLATPSPAFGYARSWSIKDRWGPPNWFPATRVGAALHGFGYGVAFLAMAVS